MLGSAAEATGSARRKLHFALARVAPPRPLGELGHVAAHGSVDGIPFERREGIDKVEVDDGPGTGLRAVCQARFECAAHVDQGVHAAGHCHPVLVSLQHALPDRHQLP